MINSIVPVQSVTDVHSVAQPVVSSTGGGKTGQVAGTASSNAETKAQTDATVGKSAPEHASQPYVRLTIEENGDHTGYVYKMVDRFTGKTIAEIPREAVSQLGASDSYSAGSVVSTSA